MTMIDRSAGIVALAVALPWLAGCGLKGDLYIREREPAGQVQAEPVPPVEVPDAGDEAEDETQSD